MKMTKEERAARKAVRAAAAQTIKNIDNLKADRKRTAEQNIPTPMTIYDIGERVVYGMWDWSAILQVYEGGNYYKLVSVTRKTNRNVPDASELKIHYLAWFEFTPYQEDIDGIEKLSQNEDIHFYFSQRDINSLLRLYFDGYGIDLDPEYQRGNVWEAQQKYDLIESIFNNIDIGKFTIIKRPWGDDGNKPLTPKLYEMLDGKQRLTAIVEYFTGKFAYKGKYYNDLHPRDKSHFKYYSVAEAETEPLTDAQKLRYFLKLNTTGTPVDPDHMKKVAGMLQEIEND